ncbi:YfiT family bacillithiol transferase [Kurthia sibirica]|uniref:Putative metal-dependent hydrolase n=1 Tax=Kurthia sibirica TaxID=202750 RepID=A0A2U3AI74_9BACL|nr:putative metal-dependent hydrolase [Kurthia sibirica]PWI24249.1 putative metal-dependent hydrolase [Kurthia sibirica]GEK34148.1 putative metal-dependent hydrolase [Kurthia sibirica]
MTVVDEQVRYPLGKGTIMKRIDATTLSDWIESIEQLPYEVKRLTVNLNDEQLSSTYRSDGWTIRQLVHHLADSHSQAYNRIRTALTEYIPSIQIYDEQGWSELADYDLPIASSLMIIEGIHNRWVYLLKNLTAQQLKRTYEHAVDGELTVEQAIGLYAWHGEHHIAHIRLALTK